MIPSVAGHQQNPLLEQPDRGPPRRLGVIGAGTIGPDIAYYLLSEFAAAELVLIDIREPALEQARTRLAAYAEKGRQRGKLTADRAAGLMPRLTTSCDYAALTGCDWVIEAATENLPLKRQIFANIEQHAGKDCLITSNTSSLPAARLFAELDIQGRATVTHFFAPAFQNPIVEIVAWPGITARNLAWLRRLFAATGKVPLTTADVVCFMLDRIFDNWCNESGLLLANGTAAEIDAVAREFVHAGPFYVLNMANGNPIIVETNSLQADEEGEHYRPAAIFSSVRRWQTLEPGQKAEIPEPRRAAIRERLLGILFSQTADILDRRIGEAQDLELGARLAFGLRQGPLALMRSAGETEVKRIVARLHKERPGMPGLQRPLAAYLDFQRFVLVDRCDEVVVITLRRPEALNALHDELNAEILGAIRAFENDPTVRGFVLTGYGTRAFCAGADIDRFPSMLGDAQAAAQYARDCSPVLLHLDRMQKPVVAAINGMALGGGLELAMRCHALVAIDEAVLQFPEVTLGIAPGIGALVVPYRRWPRAASTFHRMLAAGERVTAREALAAGILDRCVSTHGELLARAVELARNPGRARPVPAAPGAGIGRPETGQAGPGGERLSAKVQEIIAAAVVAAADETDLDAALEIGYRAFGESACTEAAREGIKAFGERRKPDFSATG
ncbi:MAG: 3-hydroxyacyl-CoA dehydrogenase/enoyl-CoA hydratase family protein [Steroidobacteraceae bacterium]